MVRAPKHQLSTLASALIVIGGLVYCVGQVVVTFIFWAALTVVHAFFAVGGADPIENDVVIASFDSAVFFGSVGLALLVFCAPRLREN